MSKQQISISKNVMAKIKTEQIKMKPKWYFWLGSISILVGLIGLTITSIFLISLVTFSLKKHGPMGAIRYQEIISTFPWWAPVIVIIGLIGGIVLLKKYDFSYKRNFIFIIAVLISAILLTGILVDILGFDDLWMKRGPMRRFYQLNNEQGQAENYRSPNRQGRRSFN